MRKLAVLILGMFLMAPQAHATYAPVAPVVVGGVHGGAILPLFAGAVTAAIAIEILNAEGVAFPLCSDGWQVGAPQPGTKCYQEYPEAIHKDGM